MIVFNSIAALCTSVSHWPFRCTSMYSTIMDFHHPQFIVFFNKSKLQTHRQTCIQNLTCICSMSVIASQAHVYFIHYLYRLLGSAPLLLRLLPASISIINTVCNIAYVTQLSSNRHIIAIKQIHSKSTVHVQTCITLITNWEHNVYKTPFVWKVPCMQQHLLNTMTPAMPVVTYKYGWLQVREVSRQSCPRQHCTFCYNTKSGLAKKSLFSMSNGAGEMAITTKMYKVLCTY